MSAAQRTDGSRMVDIYYDLANGSGEITVSVLISPDGGTTWSITPQAQYLSGDVGVVTNGTGKQIVWDMLADQPEVCWPDMDVRIIVEDESSEEGEGEGLSGSIAGVIIDFYSSAPISGVTVTLIPSNISVSTNAFGSYAITGITYGSYTVYFEMEGYETYNESLVIDSSNVFPVNASLVPNSEGEGEITPPEMVSIAACIFSMGDPWNEGGADEVPVHDVTLSAYEIGKYEITNQEYADILNWADGQGYLTTASATTAEAYGVQLIDVDSEYCQISWSVSAFVVDMRDTHSMADHPVVEVTWYGAAIYCNWLSENEGLTPCYDTSTWECTFANNGYHLPTEAQWERAAAWDGSKHYRYGNGSDSISCATVNYHDTDFCNPIGLSGYPYTSPVGYYVGVTSPMGCYDMSGNVWEWCNDWSQREYTTAAVTDPTGPSSGTHRLLRGGYWYVDAYNCRAAYRRLLTPGDRSSYLGFRVARTP